MLSLADVILIPRPIRIQRPLLPSCPHLNCIPCAPICLHPMHILAHPRLHFTSSTQWHCFNRAKWSLSGWCRYFAMHGILLTRLMLRVLGNHLPGCQKVHKQIMLSMQCWAKWSVWIRPWYHFSEVFGVRGLSEGFSIIITEKNKSHRHKDRQAYSRIRIWTGAIRCK